MFLNIQVIRHSIVLSALTAVSLIIAFSGCKTNGTNKPDASINNNIDGGQDTETSTSTATDAGADTETADIDTSDTSTDTGTGEDPTEPWEWTDLPEGEDCGPDCKQLTFSKEVYLGNWDVWDKLLVYNNEDGRNTVIDFQNNKELKIPNYHSNFPIGLSLGSLTYSPAIFQDRVCYSHQVSKQNPMISDIICANLKVKSQTVITHDTSEKDSLNVPKYIDISDTHLVSMAGCGELDQNYLCGLQLNNTNTNSEVLIADSYGSHNSIWDDIVVWYTGGYFVDDEYWGNDVRGYNFATKQFFDVTRDKTGQLFARIYKNKVVYMDLGAGDDIDGWGDWNHARVFVYDIDTGERTHIAGGDWIASRPDIHENIIIWTDYRACQDPNHKNSMANTEIWGYNLDTQKEFQITNLPGRAKTYPRIWGDKVFVHMHKLPSENGSKGNAIYMFDLPAGAK